MKAWLPTALLLAAMAIPGTGCSRSETDDAPDRVGAPGEKGVAARADAAAEMSQADDAVRELLASVRSKDPQAFWTFLPASYQRDVNDLVRRFATRMDDQLYTRLLNSTRRLTKVLREKKAYILEHPRLAQADEAGQVDAEQLAANWDGFVSLVETLIRSDQVEIEPLKTFDGGRFLAGPGRELMKQIEVLSALSEDDQFTRNLDKLENVRVTLVSESSDGTEAVVRLESPDPDEEAREIPFVKVEGKWIPRDLAESWESRIAEYRREVDEFTTPENLEIARDQFGPLLDQVDVVVAQLDEAPSQEAFNKIVQQQILAPLEFLTKNPLLGGSAAPKPTKSGTPKSVTVIVTGEIENAAAVETALQKAAGGDLTIVDEGDATRIEVTGVTDLDAFARRIEFGKVTKVDTKTRTITVEFAKPEAGDSPES